MNWIQVNNTRPMVLHVGKQKPKDGENWFSCGQSVSRIGMLRADNVNACRAQNSSKTTTQA